jgi:molybdenum cofactor cytidylyltransferase
MLASVQRGLQAQKPSAQATLVCLGDQPQIEEGSVRSVCEAFVKSKSNLVVPSYQMRRGHPWLVARPLWEEILSLEAASLRDFLNVHKNEIEYVNVDTPSILQDLDTPEDYLKYKPSL